MNIDFLIQNLTNPALLFFALGLFAVWVKSDLAIPKNSSKFISLYLLFSIEFKGGQELSHEVLDAQVFYCILFGVFLSVAIPAYTFFILKRRLSVADSGAIAAVYGSFSAVNLCYCRCVFRNPTIGIKWANGSHYGVDGVARHNDWNYFNFHV